MAVRLDRREAIRHSSLQIYLQDINHTPLLSAHEERELSDRIATGDPYAREHMVTANLRLVVNIARGYLGKGLSLEDLIEEGNLGLMRAVEGYDGGMQTRFSTYSSYWIKQSIRRAVISSATASMDDASTLVATTLSPPSLPAAVAVANAARPASMSATVMCSITGRREAIVTNAEPTPPAPTTSTRIEAT